MSFQLLIPKSAGAFFLYFISFIGVFGGMLYLYLLGPELFGEGCWFGVLFDLTSPKCLFRWCTSMLWLMMGAGSLRMLYFAVFQRQELTKSLFWLSIAVISFFLSMNTICSYTPYVCRLIEQIVRQYAGKDGAGTLTVWIIRIVCLAFFLTEANFLCRYVKLMKNYRFLLSLFFVPAVLFLVLSLVAYCWIPSGSVVVLTAGAVSESKEEKQTARLAEQNSEEKAEDKENTPESKSESKADAKSNSKSEAKSESKSESPSDGEEPQSGAEEDFHYVAFTKTEKEKAAGNSSADETQSEESPASPAVITRLEDLFGLEEIEKILNLETSWEKTIGLSQPIEDILFGGKIEWEMVIRTCELIRNGLYSLFILFFSMGLGLLGRAERVQFDEQQENILKMLKVQILDNFSR